MSYHQFLKNKGIIPSMSCKGNSQNNEMIESFFWYIKIGAILWL